MAKEYRIRYQGQNFCFLTTKIPADKIHIFNAYRLQSDSLRRANPILCQCKNDNRLTYVVKERKINGSLFIAVWPNTAKLHNRSCPGYSFGEEHSGTAIYKDGVIKERENGDFEIRVAFSLNASTKNGNDKNDMVSATSKRSSRNKSSSSSTLLCVLSKLWELAGLNQWNPSQQQNPLKQLRDASQKLFIKNGRTDFQLNNVFGICPTENTKEDKEQAEYTNKIFNELAKNNKPFRFLLFGEIDVDNFLETSQKVECVNFVFKKNNFKNTQKILPINAFVEVCSTEKKSYYQDIFKKKYPHIFSNKYRHLYTIYALALVEFKKNLNGYWKGTLKDVAFWPTYQNIPIESFYEYRVVKKLIDEQRKFSKPLSYDSAIECRPDFVLLDTDPETYGEIWGINTQDYKNKKDERIRRYEDQYLDLWQWNATKDNDPSPFPAPV